MRVLARIALDWATRCFGPEHVTNWGIRALRLVEEAIELCQALGVPKEKVLQCTETVYARPVGDAQQELGGVLLTTHILCESMALDADDIFERELRRVLKKPVREMTKRNEDKLTLGLDVKPDPDWDHRTAGRAAFFPECTREDHVCAAIDDGPCNGLPRPFKISGIERSAADRMWRNVGFRKEFDAAAARSGFDVPLMRRCNVPDYEERFNRWALSQIRKGRLAP